MAETGVSVRLIPFAKFQKKPVSVLPGTSCWPGCAGELFFKVIVKSLRLKSNVSEALTATPPGPVTGTLYYVLESAAAAFKAAVEASANKLLINNFFIYPPVNCKLTTQKAQSSIQAIFASQ
jgi:hypothetical protein